MWDLSYLTRVTEMGQGVVVAECHSCREWGPRIYPSVPVAKAQALGHFTREHRAALIGDGL